MSSAFFEKCIPEKGMVWVLYEAYLDESGDDGGFPLFGMGGYLIRPDNARKLERQWRRLLRKAKVPYFHMVDVAHGNKPFDILSKQERIALQTKCMDLIERYAEISVATFAPLDRFSDGHASPYEFCANNCLSTLSILAGNKHGEDYEISVFFEKGHKHGWRAHRILDQSPERFPKIRNIAMVEKASEPVVQAADIFIWQFAKYIKDRSRNIRPIRKDFLSILRVAGCFFHAYPMDDNSIALADAYNDTLASDRQEALLRILYAETGKLEMLLPTLPNG